MSTRPDIEFVGELDASSTERRSDRRTLTIYRLVRAATRHDEGLARCRNLSDTGVMLDLGIPVVLDDEIEIAFSASVTLHGRVQWIDGGKCGVKFERRIDSVALLSGTASEARAHRSRPPRLKAGATRRIRYDSGAREVLIEDISQHGMKLKHEDGFRLEGRVKVLLGSGIEREGVIRWTNGDTAGLMLIHPLTIEDLGSIRSILKD